ncbi:MAG: cytochrome c oxidase assembly protein [Solirubrobacteraceae bacterium]
MGPDYAWTLAPGAVLSVAVAGAVYGVRWRAVRKQRRGAPTLRLVAFLAGLLIVLVALVSPVDRLAEQLFLMHMVQHILLLDLVPILCILGFTRILLRPATRRVQAVERALGPLAHPVAAVVVYVAVIWLWHVPALYDATIRHDLVHVAEHLSFSLAGGLYWWHVLSPIRSRHRLRGIGPLAYMWSAKVGVGFLGVLLTFSPEVLYDVYAGKPDYWGMSPLTDQNVGGGFMAIEQAIVMGIALGWLFVRMLNESEEEERRAERYEEGAEAV